MQLFRFSGETGSEVGRRIGLEIFSGIFFSVLLRGARANGQRWRFSVGGAHPTISIRGILATWSASGIVSGFNYAADS